MVVALGREFRRRNMPTHLRALRIFYRALRARRRVLAKVDPPPWTEDLVLDWLAIFRIPPFERHYPTRPAHAPCPGCGAANALGLDVVNRAVHAGGYISECKRCGKEWLVLDAAAT